VRSSTSEPRGGRVGLRVASRRSPLARRQAEIVVDLLRSGAGAADDRPKRSLAVLVEPVLVDTEGDRNRAAPLGRIGGQGVFVGEVRRAVLEGRADIAVHSAKDLPASPGLGDEGLVIAAVPPRDNPYDMLVGSYLAELRPGAVVATGAPRRRAQLAWLRPDLGFVELRGNIETRLSRVPPGGAVVVAAAALERLGILDRMRAKGIFVELLNSSHMVPQVGQGALAVECRADDYATRELLLRADHPLSYRALLAERAFLAALGGGCDLPVGAHAIARPNGSITVRGMIATRDGHAVLHRRADGDDPETVGTDLASDLLDRCGGRWLMEAGG
jgi:hydroxymethylbilane synthase